MRTDRAVAVDFYDITTAPLDAEGVLARVGAICDGFECYGHRRVGAALRRQGVVVNGKTLRRLMREHGLQPKRRRRYVVTADSNHAGRIHPDLAQDAVPDRPNQFWVADLAHVAISGGFVYLAAILDAWKGPAWQDMDARRCVDRAVQRRRLEQAAGLRTHASGPTTASNACQGSAPNLSRQDL